MTADWSRLLHSGRRKRCTSSAPPPQKTGDESRTEIERDHDRILFSTPIRRLADKTQVFPLDRNDSVRNRLTHSHEVSNLARSIGTTLVHDIHIASGVEYAQRDVPAVLAAVGLVHDLGNPPFGHQGEAAIQSWFEDNESRIAGLNRTQNEIDRELFEDFLRFEGNAQAFRLVTRLQLLNDNFGLDLTYATLASMMKYPTSSCARDKAKIATKKHGYFESERCIAKDVWEKTGLGSGHRHPLAYVMEACDDIAYAVLDVEDAVKKGLASFSDLISYLQHHCVNDPVVDEVVAGAKEKHEEYRRSDLSPAELNDVSMQRFRVFAIGAMVRAVTKAFVENESSLVGGTEAKPLLELSQAHLLRECLGTFAFKHAFRHRSVLEIELQGHNAIRKLMDYFWAAISETRPDSDRPGTPLNRYVYSRISENYRRVYTNPSDDVAHLPVWYRQCLLMTDMISGMTDTFAIDILNEFNELNK
jgi:deoxyguanosinetriphosphate triphosphohydrolase, putative